MAARENQGYLIAVIILVLLTLVLALTTFLSASRMNENARKLTETEQKLVVQKSMSEAYQIEAQVLRAYVGELGPSLAEVDSMYDRLDSLQLNNKLSDANKNSLSDVFKSLKEVQGEYDKDMKLFIASDGSDQAQEQTYRNLVRNLNAVLSKAHNTETVLREQMATTQREADADVAKMTEKVTELQTTLKTTQDTMDKDKSDYQAKEQSLQASLDNAKSQNESVNRQFQNYAQTATAEQKKLKNDIKGLESEKVAMKVKLDRYEQENFDLHDGRVVRVAHKIDRVYLDLGSADGLRPNLSFAVYPQTATDFQRDEYKAMIEVTRITGDHQSEARITLEDPTNPILAKDYVLTATWDPGYSVPIALIGLFDLDGDGSSDLGRLKQMIENNGGRVVAWNDERGKITGKIDPTTRYAVLGESPEPSAEFSGALYSAINELTDQAKKNTVQQIDQRKLLNWMGRHNNATVEQLDSRIGSQFNRRQIENQLETKDLKSSDR
ncbi:MAG: hypothetical protein VYE64_08275 [Planctomycetota bacterium]|nr:hypothetical protein [Planctomycetota bacterium]